MLVQLMDIFEGQQIPCFSTKRCGEYVESVLIPLPYAEEAKTVIFECGMPAYVRCFAHSAKVEPLY